MSIRTSLGNPLIVWFLATAWSSALAAQSTDVCIVDVALVFKNHVRFNEQLNQLQRDAEALNAQLQQRSQQLLGMAEQLRGTNPGSPEFQQLERQLAEANANLEVDHRSKMRELVVREARLHYDIYVEVSQAIGVYCEQRGVRLVLRFDSTPMTPDNPQSIMQRVNSDVVFYAPHKDITAAIIAHLNQSSAPRVGQAPSDAAPR